MDHATRTMPILKGLGRTADEIAARLRTIGVKRIRNTGRFMDPVVRYLRMQLRGAVTVDARHRGTKRLAS